MGLVGLHFGRRLIDKQVINGPGGVFVEICGVTSLDPLEAGAAADQWAVAAYPSFQAMLDDRDLEAIALFTGPVGRAQLVQRCIEAGKHVLTTKPFDVDPSAAEQVLRLARQRGIVVHTNSPSPLASPVLRQIQAWREQHDLGRAVAARRESYDSYQEQADGSWKDSPQDCPVAPIFRLGIYGINDLLRLLGRVECVQVMATRIRTGRPTPDNAFLNLQFEGGALASLFHSFCIRDGQAHSADLKVYYERGSIKYRTERNERGNASMLTLYRGNYSHPLIETSEVAIEAGGGYGWRDFHDAVRGIANPLTGDVIWGSPPELVGDGLRVIAAMRRSEQSNSIERV